MKLALFHAFLFTSYLFIYVVLCTGGDGLKPKDNKGVEMMIKEEKAIREIFEYHIRQIMKPLVDIILDYNKKIDWRTRKLDSSVVEGQEFKYNTNYLYVNCNLEFLESLTRNSRTLSYDTQSNDLIIEEETKCLSNPTGNMRKKSLRFALVEREEIRVYLGRQFLIIYSQFPGNYELYNHIDIYDLNDQEFWNTEFKANLNGKTILTGDESYGTHIEPKIRDSIREVGMWRDGKEEEYVMIFLKKGDAGFKKFINKELRENIKDPDNNNNDDNLVIGIHGNIVILDLKLIKGIDIDYWETDISFTSEGQIMRIESRNEQKERIALYYRYGNKVVLEKRWGEG